MLARFLFVAVDRGEMNASIICCSI